MGLTDDQKTQLMSAGVNTGQDALSTLMGMLTAKWQDRRQLKQAEKLQALQLMGQKDMANFQQGLAYDMWQKTNYDAQMEQMKKAGLSPSLMYDGQGSGGSTQGAGTGSGIGGQQAASSQDLLTQAQIRNINADTELKNRQGEGIGQDIEESKTRIEDYASKIENRTLQNGLLELQTKSVEWDNKLKEGQLEGLIETVNQDALRAASLAQREFYAQQIDAETYEDTIKLIREEAALKAVEVRLAEAQRSKYMEDINLSKAQQRKLQKEIVNLSAYYDLTSQELDIRKAANEIAQKLAEFETSTPQQIKQWTARS